MHGLITIALRDLPFYAFHGYYKEEKKTGNDFIVNLTVQFQSEGTVTHISDTVNYTSLYSFLEQEMKIPRELLETFLAETVEKLHSKFPILKKIELSITKLHPPIAGFQGKIAVELVKEFT